MWQTAFKIQAETWMSCLPFPQRKHYFCMLYCIVFSRRDWEVMSKTRASCFIRGSKHLKKNKSGLVLLSVFRCLEPLMKHSHSYLIYYIGYSRAFDAHNDRCKILYDCWGWFQQKVEMTVVILHKSKIVVFHSMVCNFCFAWIFACRLIDIWSIHLFFYTITNIWILTSQNVSKQWTKHSFFNKRASFDWSA